MAAPMNITIPTLKPGERIEEWQPLFVAATSSLAAHAGEPAVIQILPSYVCRDEFERDTTLLAIKEETVEAAFKVLRNALDAPIDEFEATTRFRKMVWARGVRIEVFFTLLWKEAKRGGFYNRQVCVVIVTQLPNKTVASIKRWLREREGDTVSDTQMREFIGLVQQNLRQMDVPLDFGAREAEVKTVDHCMVVDKESKGEWVREDPYIEQETPQVCKVRQFSSDRRYGRMYRGASRREDHLNCFTCSKRGHGYQRCPERICRECHGKGHDAHNCTRGWRGNNWRSQDRGGYARGDYVKNLSANKYSDERAASIIVRVGDRSVQALLDTGAKVNVMDVRTLRELELVNYLRPDTGLVYGVCGTPISVVGCVEIPISVPGAETCWTQVHVLEGEEQALLLGRQFLKAFGRVIFDWEEGSITLGSARIEIQEQATGGDPLARARSVKQIDRYSEDQLLNGPKTDLSNEQQTEFVKLLKEFKTLFNENPGRTTLCEHAIDTGEASPRKSRPRPLPPQWEEEINLQLDELLTQKLCRPSKSPWASNVVLVTKKDGRKRFAVDYRGVNGVTKKDAYGIPQVQAILDRLHSFQYFSVIDISAAYWCVPMREEDVEKTAFNTPRGLFEMIVMPFGLVNSQATFQRLMDNTLQGLKRTESYIDDCIIFSNSFEQHIEDLRAVFNHLHRAKLHVKLKKCQFCRDEVEFLGHLVSKDGRRPISSSAVKLSKFPRPHTVAELQRFLGSINFYRSYIPEMSRLAAPLYKLTRKGETWVWNNTCEEAFDTLRHKLTREPIMLAFPNWEETFVIEADASTRAVAAVLSQRNKHTGQLHPIDFFSSALSSAQRNYSAGQLEAWALVAACRKWRTYLGARGEVELITDHCPLKWLRSQKDPRRTYARWILELEEYSYNIIHRPGRENNLPDYLSRIPTIEIDAEVQNECTFEDKIFTVVSQHEEEPKLNLAQIRMEQERDPITRNAREQLRFKRIVTSGKFRHVAEHLGLSDGVLLFQNRIVVPGDSRDDVLVRVHAAGHFGKKRTLQNLRRNYFWLGMARYARRFCQRCRTCQKAKALNRAKVPIQEFKAEGLGPGDLVAMDIATLPWADEKYRYFLCIVDIFTRYIELCPMRDQSAASVVREFERGWIFRGHGVPRGLLTDQAHNIDGVEVRRMCDKLGIEKRHSSPYHPQGDGMVERSIV